MVLVAVAGGAHQAGDTGGIVARVAGADPLPTCWLTCEVTLRHPHPRRAHATPTPAYLSARHPGIEGSRASLVTLAMRCRMAAKVSNRPWTA